MPKNTLANPIFHDEDAARLWFEKARWPNGPICPKCGSAKHYATKKLGRYRCGNPVCRKDFTIMTGSVMERSHAKLTQWAAAFHLAASSKKGFAAHQLMREIGCQYNTAWFLHHRVMEAMRRGGLDTLSYMGGEGKVVEVDETYYGKLSEEERPKAKKDGRPFQDNPWSEGKRNKRSIIALVERGGDVRSFHVPAADRETVVKIVLDHIYRETRLNTDESGLYTKVGRKFEGHDTVNHSAKEYARQEYPITGEPARLVTTNTVEGYFGIFKRGMSGVYQHCKEKHLHRYLAEFDFRYNTRKIGDMERTIAAIKGGEGKRLTYHQPH